jgi:gliding motility-associated-like protein
LTITPIDQTITFTDVPEKLFVGKTYTLAATSTSGLEVLFESLNPQIASVSGNQITGVSKGTVQIKAYNQGNQNYNPAETLASAEVYSTHRDIMNLFTPNNDGFNDLWEIPDLASYGKSDVKVYNRWGKLVFSSSSYDNTWNGTSDGKDLPEGAYYYVIKTQNSGTITGTVNIVR